MTVTTNPDFAKEVATNKENFGCVVGVCGVTMLMCCGSRRHRRFSEAIELVAKGILTMDYAGEAWKKHRHVLAPAFRPHNMRYIFEVTLEHSLKLVDLFLKQKQVIIIIIPV